MRPIVVLGLALALGLASVAAGQGTTSADAWHNARRLGGSMAFYTPPLKTAASLKQMAARKGVAEDIRTVLRQSGIPDTADGVLAALAGAASAVKGGSCDEATPADGAIVECDVQPGSTLLWMAYRPHARRGIRTPGRLERVRWAGRQPFRAFLFRVTNDYKIYTFVVPKPCANVSLMSVKDIEGEPVGIAVARSCDPSTNILRVTITASSRDLARVERVRVGINGQPAGELTAPSWTLTSDKPGDYTFDATEAKGRPYPVTPPTAHVDDCPRAMEASASRAVTVQPTCKVVLSSAPVKGGYEITVDATQSTTGTPDVAPAVSVDLRDDAGAAVGQTLTLDSSLTAKIVVHRPGTYRATATVSTPRAVEVGGSRYEGTVTCEDSITIEQPAGGGPSFFVDALVGKERRVRPLAGTDLDFAQCSPLLGLKAGVAKRFANDWEVAGAAGVAISLVNDDRKVKESELFVDAEVNKYLSGGFFVGTGLSLWDLTRSETWTPAWLLHFGLPLTRNARFPVFFIGEGRLFFDHIDDVSNNYQFWGGVRVQFRRR